MTTHLPAGYEQEIRSFHAANDLLLPTHQLGSAIQRSHISLTELRQFGPKIADAYQMAKTADEQARTALEHITPMLKEAMIKALTATLPREEELLSLAAYTEIFTRHAQGLCPETMQPEAFIERFSSNFQKLLPEVLDECPKTIDIEEARSAERNRVRQQFISSENSQKVFQYQPENETFYYTQDAAIEELTRTIEQQRTELAGYRTQLSQDIAQAEERARAKLAPIIEKLAGVGKKLKETVSQEIIAKAKLNIQVPEEARLQLLKEKVVESEQKLKELQTNKEENWRILQDHGVQYGLAVDPTTCQILDYPTSEEDPAYTKIFNVLDGLRKATEEDRIQAMMAKGIENRKAEEEQVQKACRRRQKQIETKLATLQEELTGEAHHGNN